MKDAIWQCELDERAVSFRKRTRHSWGEWQTTNAREMSWFLNNPWFVLIRKYINHEMFGLERDEHFHFRPRARAASKGLRDFAKFFGLHPHSDGTTRQLWLVNTPKDKHGKRGLVPLCQWRILSWSDKDKHGLKASDLIDLIRANPDKVGHEFRKLERSSEALMRDTIVIFRDGWALIPARTRKDDRRR